jgi:hypothetical protein
VEEASNARGVFHLVSNQLIDLSADLAGPANAMPACRFR